MKKSAYAVTVLSILSLLIVTSVLANSSGSFTATGLPANCTATPAKFSASTCTNSGQCLSGLSCVNGLCIKSAFTCSDSSDCMPGTFCNSEGACEGIGGFFGDTLTGGLKIPGYFKTQIRTPNGQGTTLLIRPSLNTGLFTASKLTTTINNATSDVGIEVCVLVDPDFDANGNPIEGTGLEVKPSRCIVYDQRIQQVSNTLFGNLARCIPPLPSGACTGDTDCSAGSICINPTDVPGAGLCQAPAPDCNFEILLTTLSAHSSDFVVEMPGNGDHKVFMTWKLIGTGTSGGGTVDACVGPGLVTVEQVKNFKNNAAITFDSN